MAKKTLGYGFKLSTETFKLAVAVYGRAGGYCKTRKEVLNDIKIGKKSGNIPKNARPVIFKVTVET